MQKTEERTFEDEQGKLKVLTTQLPAMRAFKLLARLGKLLGPAIGQLRGVQLKSDTAALVPALTTLLSSLDPDEADLLVSQLLEGTMVVSAQAISLKDSKAIDEIFGGRLLLMLKIMAFAVEVNYADFFRGLSPSGGGASALPASP